MKSEWTKGEGILTAAEWWLVLNSRRRKILIHSNWYAAKILLWEQGEQKDYLKKVYAELKKVMALSTDSALPHVFYVELEPGV